MIARHDGTPIKLPKPCTSAAAIGAFSRDTIAALVALRDRRVLYDAPRTKGASIYHEWKTTFGGPTETPGDYIWRYVGGDVVTQGGTFTVADGEVEGPEGFLVLKITRDSASREATAAAVEHSETLPVSDYTYQYVVLAILTPETENVPAVLQLQFERLNIHEMFLVTNGEFDFGQVRMASDNIYDLPP